MLDNANIFHDNLSHAIEHGKWHGDGAAITVLLPSLLNTITCSAGVVTQLLNICCDTTTLDTSPTMPVPSFLNNITCSAGVITPLLNVPCDDHNS